ncbi:MAG: alpha/beta hydrolase fold domain-containing protein [Clostridium sp.]
MKTIFNPGTKKKTLTLVDNVVYSTVKDLNGDPLELKLSVLLQNGNSEMRAAMGKMIRRRITVEAGTGMGTGRRLERHRQEYDAGEMTEFVNAGYVVASIYYRSSAQGHYPDQLIDVKTAIRFLRAHAAEFEINPEKIGIFGRSAGAHLSAAAAAMNQDGFDSEEWSGYSSKVQACCDMFGPVDIKALMENEEKQFSNPSARWQSVEETHGGCLLGGDPATMKERGAKASPVNMVNQDMCPIQILHGDNDPLVPVEISSETLYQKIVAAGMEDKVDYYVIPGAGHGTREFFQDATKELQIAFFDKYLK